MHTVVVINLKSIIIENIIDIINEKKTNKNKLDFEIKVYLALMFYRLEIQNILILLKVCNVIKY